MCGIWKPDDGQFRVEETGGTAFRSGSPPTIRPSTNNISWSTVYRSSGGGGGGQCSGCKAHRVHSGRSFRPPPPATPSVSTVNNFVPTARPPRQLTIECDVAQYIILAITLCAYMCFCVSVFVCVCVRAFANMYMYTTKSCGSVLCNLCFRL